MVVRKSMSAARAPDDPIRHVTAAKMTADTLIIEIMDVRFRAWCGLLELKKHKSNRIITRKVGKAKRAHAARPNVGTLRFAHPTRNPSRRNTPYPKSALRLQASIPATATIS